MKGVNLMNRKGYLYALISSVLLGFMAILVKIVLDRGVPVTDVIFFRFFLASAVLLIYLKIRGVSFRVDRRQLLLLMLTGLVGYGVMNLCYYGAFLFISVGMASMIHFIYPVVAVFFSWLFYRNRFAAKIHIAAGFAVVGAMLISLSELGNFHWQGIVLAVLAGVFYGLCAALMEHPRLKVLSGTVVVFYLSVFAFLFMLAGDLVRGRHPLEHMTLSSFGIMVVVAAICTVFALILFRNSIVYIGSVRATILSTMEPVSAALLGAVLLWESLDFWFGVGSLLVLVSVFLVTKDHTVSESEVLQADLPSEPQSSNVASSKDG